MTRALGISQHQAQVLLRAAEAENGVVEVKLGNTFVRLIPSSHVKEALRPVDEPKPTVSPLNKWREKRDADKANRGAYRSQNAR